MKKCKKTVMIAAAVLTLLFIMAAVPVSAVNANLDTTRKVSFTVSCSDAGYEFTLYKLASLTKTTVSPFDVKYTAAVASLQDEIDAGVTAKKDGTLTANMWESAPAANAILAAADALSTTDLNSIVVKVNNTALKYVTDTDGATKTFSNLDQGIYYLKATSFPTNVNESVNSIISLPYYDSANGWTYTINTVPLAAKVSERVPGITKKIIKNNAEVDYENVMLGDTVTFKIKANVMGSHQHPLTNLIIVDTASAGITLGDSITIRYLASNGTVIKTVSSDMYTYSKTTGRIGFKAAELVSASELYDADIIEVTLTGVVNKNAVVGKAGNDNTSQYGWTVENNSDSVADTDETKVYTQKLEITKTDESGTPLQGAQFELYSDSALQNKIASGTSDVSGKVVFKNDSGDTMLLETGTYYAVETQSPANYNRYTDTITVQIGATYNQTFTNGSWVNTLTAKANNTAISMTDGVASFTVTNSKVVLPQTGGAGNLYLYIIAGVLMLLGIAGFIYITRKDKNEDRN